MADSVNRKSFFRGLLAAVLVVVFTQAWFWYAQNRSSEKAIYDIKTEIRENAFILDLLKQGMSAKNAPDETDWLRVRRILEKLSRAAYERSRPSFDKSSHSFYDSLSDYYSRLRQLQSTADDSYERSEYLLRQKEKFEKGRDAQYQQLTSLALSTQPNQNAATVFEHLKKQLDLNFKAVVQTEKFQEQASQSGMNLLSAELTLVESAKISADASTDGLIAENHEDRILLVTFLFLMPFLIFFAILPSSPLGTPGATAKSNNDSVEAASNDTSPS